MSTTLGPLTIAQPWFALLLPLVILLWFFPKPPRTITHGVIRSAFFVLAVMALMRPVFVAVSETNHYVLVLDQSASIEANARTVSSAVSQELVTALNPLGNVALVHLGSEETALEVERVTTLTFTSSSNLGDALAIATESIPIDGTGSITLISDGLATDQHWGSATGHLIQREIPLHTLDLYEESRDLRVTDLVRSSARVGELAQVDVRVKGYSTDYSIQLQANGETVDAYSSLDVEGEDTLSMQFTPSRPGFIDLEVSVRDLNNPNDDQTNNVIRDVLSVHAPYKVLLWQSENVPSIALWNEFGGGFATFESIEDRRELSAELLADYDVLILDDVAASSIDLDAQEQITSAIQEQGLGLFLSGGSRAFADGGYANSNFASILPLDLYGNQDKLNPSVGLAIILDTSGSMAGSRIELAKHLARIAVRRMQPHDRIGIVEFYGNKHWAVPMQPATNKIEIDRAIGRMKAIGGTVLYPAIQEAYYGLQNVNTRYKHIVMITDAGVESSNYEPMLRRIAEDRVNVSTILVGQGGHNQIMFNLANWGHGRFYAVGNQFQLVEMIFKQPSVKEPPLYREGEFAVLAHSGPSWWHSTDRFNVPPVAGYTETSLRDGAELLLTTETADHPILASWHYGLGRVTTLTTTPFRSGSESWQNWEELPEFLSRVLAKTTINRDPFEISIKRKHHAVKVLAIRSDPGSNLIPLAQAYSDRDTPSSTLHPFNETAPGYFELSLFRPSEEPVYMSIGSTSGSKRVQFAALAPSSDIRAETQVDRAYGLPMQQLSELTGGSVLNPSDAVDQVLQSQTGVASFVSIRLWPWLLLLVLALFIGDLLYRRLPRDP